MSPTEVLRSAFRTASASLCATRPSSRSGTFYTHFGVFAICLIALTGCSDGLTAPASGLDRDAVSRVMPAVMDARLRVTNGFGDVAVRQRVWVDLSDLELALRSGSADKAQSLLRKITSEITDYGAQASYPEGADMTAMFLMLQTVSQVVDAGHPVL
jgi:hypothetical protein